MDSQKRPFFWLGDTPWTLFTTYSRDDVIEYFDDRASKGFSVLQAVFCWRDGNTCARNLDGETPFIGGDLSAPNPSYFRNVDWIIDQAEQRNIMIALVPMWSNALIAPWNTIINARQAEAYGRYLGERYSDRRNIVWVLGGDTMVYDKAAIHRSMAAGIRSTDRGNKLMTFHPSADTEAGHGGVTTDPRFNPFTAAEYGLDVNMGQSWGFRFDLTRVCSAMYADHPAKPGVLAEGSYEGADREYPTGPVTPELVRREAWWAYLSGVSYSYGNMEIWAHTKDWRRALSDPGANSLSALRRSLEARNWWRFAPLPEVVPVDLRRPADNSLSGAIAASSLDGDGILVYFSQPAAGVVYTYSLSASTEYTAKWVHPEDGYETEAEELTNVGTHTFKSPDGWVDAVLVLDAVREEPTTIRPRRAPKAAAGFQRRLRQPAPPLGAVRATSRTLT